MRWRRPKGLRFEIIGNLGVVSLFALLSTGLGVWFINGRHMMNQEIQYGMVMTETLAEQVAGELAFEDSRRVSRGQIGQEKLEGLLKRCREKNPRLQLILVDLYFRVRASTGGEAPGEVIENQTLSSCFSRGTTRTRLHGRAPGIGYFHEATIAVPIERDGRLLGGVLARLSLDEVLKSARQTEKFMLFYMGIGALVLVLFGTILISRTLVRPLERMVKVMRRVAEGDLDQRVSFAGDNEVGQLASSFNTMAEKLKVQQEALSQTVAALQQMNHELKESQQEVIQSEKLASVGLLAAGVAHEVGNPLGAILGYISILEDGTVGGEEREDLLKRTEKEVLRIHRIVKDLKEYSRPTPCEIQELDVNRIVEDSVNLVRHQTGFQKVHIECHFDLKLPRVRMDEGQFQQVLVNLFLNARDAVNRQGTITVVTRHKRFVDPGEGRGGPVAREGDPRGVDFRLLRKENPARKWPFLVGQRLVEVEVRDGGAGIAKEEIPRVFDPFYSTKEPGEGTGLGLSVSQRIIESFHGKIQISSRWGEGTTVGITLPAADEEGITLALGREETRKNGTTCLDRG